MMCYNTTRIKKIIAKKGAYKLFELKNIQKSYGETEVLSDVALTVENGQWKGLAGKNGSGKSTLMRISAQVQNADSGDILFDGTSVLGNREFLKTKLAYIPQEDALAEFLTVKQQLEFWQSAVGSKDENAIELMGISDLMKKRISSLSGGQKKRVSIAMAFQSHPQYIVADEAFSALDVEFRSRSIDLLRNAQKNGSGILWCTHDFAEISELCDSCYALKKSKIYEISSNEISNYLFMT